MRVVRVLFYADMEAVVPHCIAAAEMLRSQLGAQIIMVVPDLSGYANPALQQYELYDHDHLFRISAHYVSDTTKLEVGAAFDGRRGGEVRGSLRTRLRKAVAQIEILKSNYLRLRKKYHRLRELLDPRRTEFGQAVAQLRMSWRRAASVPTFLKSLRPDVMIFAEDNIERMSTTFINVGAKQGIPSIVIPFTIPNPLEPAKAYRGRRLNQVRGPVSRLVGRFYPKWRFSVDGLELLRMPALSALALEMFGQSSPAPWVLNRGRAARIVLDSEALRDTYLKLGFPQEQLTVVGDVNGGILHQSLTNRSRRLADLLAQHGFQSGRPLIVCGFPPNQFGTKMEEFEFENYDALVEGWVGSFRDLGERANILIRPHPRIDPDRFKSFVAPNLRFTLQPTAELIPLCDLYVASISATIRWAIACGIPVINYDTYRYRYGDYDMAPAVISTDSLADFRTNLARFVDDPLFAAKLTQQQRADMGYWGIVDDQLPKRFAAVVSELTGLA